MSALTLLTGLVATGCAVTCRPAWYVPASLDQTLRKADKRDLVNLLDDIGAALNAGESFEFEVAQNQLNRWIAARSEWPVPPAAELEAVQYPQVMLLDRDRVRVAGTIERAGFSWVVSLVFKPELRGDELLLRFEGLQLGRLPLPRAWILKAIRSGGLSSDSAAQIADGGVLTMRNRWTWKNGRRPFRVGRIRISEGRLQAVFEPMARIP